MAIDPRHSRQLRLNLGPEEHTVYEAELVGILLALNLAFDLPKYARHIYLCLDNQAAIRACCTRPGRQSGQYILLRIHEGREKLVRTHSRAEVSLTWTPGHLDIPGNEAADEQAKEATADPSEDLPGWFQPLLASVSAARQAAKKHFTPPPENTKTAAHHRRYRGALSSRRTSQLLGSLSRRHCSILTQLRSCHIALRQYLARFARAEDPHCPSCGVPENVRHFLLECRRYTRQREQLIRSVRALDDRELRVKATDLATLLSEPEVVPITLQYVAETRRFPLYFQ